MSQTDKEAALANKARVVEQEATGESGSLSTKAKTEPEAAKTEQTEPETAEAKPAEPKSKTSSDSADADLADAESDEDRANREHDEALRAQYDRVHEVAAAGGDNGENEV